MVEWALLLAAASAIVEIAVPNIGFAKGSMISRTALKKSQ